MKKATAEKYEAYMTVEDVCVYLAATKETVYRWIKKKGLPAHRVGKLWLFQRSDIDLWIKSGEAAEQ